MFYLEYTQKILKFDEKEQNRYNQFCKDYSNIEKDYGIGNVDFDLLISGLTTSQTRGSSALISNDFGIVRAGRYLSRKESFSKEKFGFFRREEVDTFKTLGL